MIVYSLNCAKQHEFEAWFRDSAAYEVQVAKRAVVCPECGSTKIAKAPMAPRLGRRRGPDHEPSEAAPAANAAPAAPQQTAMMAREALEAIKKQVEEKCEYVGERFPEEARKIHYGETAQRDIYGEASDEEAETLADEGVAFHRIPWIRRTQS